MLWFLTSEKPCHPLPLDLKLMWQSPSSWKQTGTSAATASIWASSMHWVHLLVPATALAPGLRKAKWPVQGLAVSECQTAALLWIGLLSSEFLAAPFLLPSHSFWNWTSCWFSLLLEVLMSIWNSTLKNKDWGILWLTYIHNSTHTAAQFLHIWIS